jgi:hypothetical protein
MAVKNGHIRTSEIALEAGVHPNTVHLYKKWGFLPPVPRGPNGCRIYSMAHLDQMLLAQAALHGGWPGRSIRRSALAIVRHAAGGDFEGARRRPGRIELRARVDQCGPQRAYGGHSPSALSTPRRERCLPMCACNALL